MARGKKKESALTPEEKLAQALVLESEQPYTVPKNWCWTKAGNMVTLYRGVSYKKNDAHTEKGENDCLIMRGGNISEGGIDTEADNVYVNKDLVTQEQLVKKHDIIIVSSTGSTKVIGRAGISLMDYDDVAFGAFLTLLRPVDYVSKSFVDYYFQSDLYRERIRSLASGVNINNIRTEYITESPVPLPPLAEQQRIVDRIEYLFAKLDEAKEKAQSMLDSFETRKAAILHKAFTGELTVQWRAEHNIGPETWKSVLFDNCIAKMQNGLAKRSGNNGIPFAVLRLANLSDNGFVTDDLRQIVLDEKEQENYRLMPDDVLMIRVNGSKDNVGKQFLMGDQKDWAFCDHIIRIRYSDGILPAYMVLFSKSDVYRLYVKDNMVSSAGQNTISRKGMAHLAVPVPLVDEQTEIVRILDSLFAKEQQAKEAAEAVLEKIDLLKKSILARAFRGELGTNDPTEESALELLKEILKGDI